MGILLDALEKRAGLTNWAKSVWGRIGKGITTWQGRRHALKNIEKATEKIFRGKKRSEIFGLPTKPYEKEIQQVEKKFIEMANKYDLPIEKVEKQLKAFREKYPGFLERTRPAPKPTAPAVEPPPTAPAAEPPPTAPAVEPPPTEQVVQPAEQSLTDKARGFIRQHPFAVVGGAVGGGYLLSRLLSSRRD